MSKELYLLEDNIGRWVEIEDGEILRCGFTDYSGRVLWSGPDRAIRDYIDNLNKANEDE